MKLTRFTKNFRLAVPAITICITGCTMVGPDYISPQPKITDQWPAMYQKDIKTDTTELRDWWKTLNDPTLDTLIERAYAQNLTLQTAGLRVLESKARLAQAVGELYPQQQNLTGSFIYTRQNGSVTGIGATTYSQDEIGIQAGWEIDFWGKFRRAIEASDAALLGSVASYDTVLVSLLGQTATTYITIRTLEERIRIAQDNVKIQMESSKIAEARFQAGTTSERDYQQSLTQLYATEAVIPSLEIALQQAKSALALLLGEVPGQLDVLLARGNKRIPATPREVVLGIPTDLLRRRPDLRAAELAAASRSAQIGIAEAELYPAFSLTGEFVFNSSDRSGSSLNEIWNIDNRAGFVGPSFRWPIFNYGQLRNIVRAQDALFQQSLTDYENAVLSAQKEVEDALISFMKSKEEVEIRTRAVAAARRTVELATVQYNSGATDYTTVINAQQSLLIEESALARAQGDVPQGLVTIFVALGGGWQIRGNNDFVPEVTKEQMRQRTDWGDLLDAAPVEEEPSRRSPTW